MKVLIGRSDIPNRQFTARLLWEPRDIWLGVFWNGVPGFVLIYVCLLPCFPVAIAWRRG